MKTDARANLYGQEANGTVWSIAKMNMLLHGIRTADLQNEDTLADPQHVEGGELKRFDRVLTNPPFSINWGNTEKDREGRPLWAPTFPAWLQSSMSTRCVKTNSTSTSDVMRTMRRHPSLMMFAHTC